MEALSTDFRQTLYFYISLLPLQFEVFKYFKTGKCGTFKLVGSVQESWHWL